MNIMNLYVYENRSISNDLSKPIMLENLNVDTVRIHLPKEIDGTDMGTWAWWFVYQNAKKEKFSIPMILESATNDDEEEEYIAMVALDHGFTGRHGTVMYAVEALQADGSGAITGEWHTITYKINVLHTIQGGQTEYSETQEDIISALLVRINELMAAGGAIADLAEVIEGAAETAQEVIDSIPQDYSALSSDVDGLKANLSNLDDRVDALESGGGGSGLTPSVKNALLACFANVAWKDEDSGPDCYDDLYNVLYPPAPPAPPASLTSITAVYTQSGTVYSDDSLDGLKSDLVVTALYDNGTSQVISTNAYTLTGNLNSATSTITVAFSGKTATFNVSVTLVGDIDYADDLANWFLTRVTGAATYSDGKITIKGSQTNADAYKLLCLDRAKTLWDTVNGKKLRIRVTMDSPDWVGEISTESPQNRVLVGLAIYKNSTINTGNDRQKIQSLAQILPSSTPTTYEFIFDADIENFDSGSGTPTSVSTFGVSIYNVSANTLEITGCSIVEVLTS